MVFLENPYSRAYWEIFVTYRVVER